MEEEVLCPINLYLSILQVYHLIFLKSDLTFTDLHLNIPRTTGKYLKKFTEPGEMEKYLDKQALLDQFVQFAASNGIKKDPAGLKTSGAIIHTQIKAYIAT